MLAYEDLNGGFRFKGGGGVNTPRDLLIFPTPKSEIIVSDHLFSFALTKTYTIQVQQFIYMRQNKRWGHHNSLHQLLWALQLKLVTSYRREKKNFK